MYNGKHVFFILVFNCIIFHLSSFQITCYITFPLLSTLPKVYLPDTYKVTEKSLALYNPYKSDFKVRTR